MCAGAVDLLEAVQIGDGMEGVTRSSGFCPKRARRMGQPMAEGLPDLAYTLDENAQLRVNLQDAFPREFSILWCFLWLLSTCSGSRWVVIGI